MGQHSTFTLRSDSNSGNIIGMYPPIYYNIGDFEKKRQVPASGAHLDVFLFQLEL